MIKKKDLYMLLTLTLIFTIAIMLYKNDHSTLENDILIKEFTDTINKPDDYRITDFDRYYEYSDDDRSPTQLADTNSSAVSFFIDNPNTVEDIHNIINSKEYTSISGSVYDIFYHDYDKTAKFWLYSFIDSDIADEYFHAYQITLNKNKDIYLFVSRNGEEYCLKSSLTDDEFNYIQEIYTEGMKKEVE